MNTRETYCVVCGINKCLGDYCSGACRAKASRARKKERTQEAHERPAHATNSTVDRALTNEALHGPFKPEVHILRAKDLAGLMGTQPTYLDKDTGLSHLSCEQLAQRLVGINYGWQGSAEFAERTYRVVHRITTHAIPHHLQDKEFTPYPDQPTHIVTGKPGDDDYNGVCKEHKGQWCSPKDYARVTA